MTGSRNIMVLISMLAVSLLAVACSGPASTSSGAQPTKSTTSSPAVVGATPPSAPPIPTPTAQPAPGYASGSGPGTGPGMGQGSPAAPGSGPGYGPGMGPGRGPGTGYGGGTGPGMMGPGGRAYNQNGSPLTIDQAVQIANQYISSAGNPDLQLQLASIHQFSNAFEAEYAEKSTGVHAFEILIDPYSGAAYPEMGPNVMWNTKYGGMGGMRGGPSAGEATTKMPISVDTAKQNAQQWLSANLQGTTLASDVDTAYGYYEMMVQKDGKEYGQIDVNGYGGQVWYEDWHGTFVQSREIKAGG